MEVPTIEELAPYAYGFAVIIFIMWVTLIVAGWIFFCRGVATGESRIISGIFAILGTFFAPFSTIPISLNART